MQKANEIITQLNKISEEKDAQILQNNQMLLAVQTELEEIKKNASSTQMQQAEKEKRLVVLL